jgi:hypothetical protein
MKVRGLAWVTGIALAACSAGEVRAPRPADTGAAASAAPVSAPMATAEARPSDTLSNGDSPALLPSDENYLAGPALPPEVVSVMTYDQYRLTLDPHGAGITAFETGSSSAVDVVLGTPSVVDDPAPPADMEVE